MEVKIGERDGVKFFYSAQAEAARKFGCLCTHKENGQRVMCEHLKSNIAYEESLLAEITPNFPASEDPTGVSEKAKRAIAEIFKILISDRAHDELKNLTAGMPMFAEDGVCRAALVNFAVCLSGNLAMAVSRCPYFEADKSAP